MTKIVIVALLTLFALATPTLGANGTGQLNRTIRAQVATPSPVRQGLAEAKLRVCQNREQAINRNMEQLTQMATNMVAVFDGISTRVETYYTEVAIPAGVTVANYGTLLSDIAAKEALVDTALANAQTNTTDFSCDGDDPLTTLSQFRVNMRAVKNALREYRTAISKLIVAVRTASSERPTTTPSL